MRKVVVTGLGAITPVGNNVNIMWENIKKGTCGIAPITSYDASSYKVKLAAEVKDFNPEEYLDKREVRKLDRFVQFALVAANEAFADAKIDTDALDLDRCGVIVSSGIGGLSTIQKEDIKGYEKGYDRISPFFIPMSISNMASAQIAIKYGFHGICTSVVTACAGGTNAIGEAYRHIKDGYGDMVICGGTESCINPLGVGGFTSLKALSQSENPSRASIPFDKERNGFVIGEGAGILILEDYEHAKKRNAKIYCEVAGYDTNCDAFHITAPCEDGAFAGKCMENAIKSANITATDIDYINAHGTSTKLNDMSETKAIKNVFGDNVKRLKISSTKSMTGHLLGASGAVEGIVSVLSVKNDFIPATINYQVPDEECDLDVVPNEGINKTVNYAMSNSLGFGGHNASLIFKKMEA